MKSKKKIIGIGIIVLCVLSFVGYKAFLLVYFNHSDKEYREIFNEITDLSIHKNVINQNASVGNLHYFVPIELKEEKQENGQKIYVERDDNGNQVAQLTIGLANLSSLEDTKQSLNFVHYEKLAKKYNIQDEIDLYHYYYEHKEENANIFWSSSHIKMNGFVNHYMLIVSSGGTSCHSYFLNDDLKGYLLECSNRNVYDAYFVYEKELYVVNFMGKESTSMTYQEFIKILESISFA